MCAVQRLPVKCGLDILHWETVHTEHRRRSLCNPREFSENSKLVLFQTKFVEEEEVEPGMLGLRKCESLESAFGEM